MRPLNSHQPNSDPKTSLALVAQGIEHGSPKAGVAGSNPAGGTRCLRSSAVFFESADRPWLALVGAVVGDFLAPDDAPWLAIVNRAAASSRDAMFGQSVGNRPAVVQRYRRLIRASTRSTGPAV